MTTRVAFSLDTPLPPLYQRLNAIKARLADLTPSTISPAHALRLRRAWREIEKILEQHIA